jgi:hypothetical protein
MPDIPTWTITITGENAEADRRMVLAAVLADCPGWDAGTEMRAFMESTRNRLQAGELSITGDRFEVEAVLNAVNNTFPLFLLTDGFKRLSVAEQTKARNQAAYATKWLCAAGASIDAAPKGHGTRKVKPVPVPEPVKPKGKNAAAAGARSLFGDEG